MHPHSGSNSLPQDAEEVERVDTLDCYKRIKKILSDFEKARKSHRKISVTELARKIASPRSHGGSWENGYRVHRVWGDPLEACMRDEYWTPLPLAYFFRGTWIYGVADFVRFIDGVPREVVELKYYREGDRYAEVQAAIYGWLVSKIFSVKPRVWLVLGWNGKTFEDRVEVKAGKVEDLIKKVLEGVF